MAKTVCGGSANVISCENMAAEVPLMKSWTRTRLRNVRKAFLQKIETCGYSSGYIYVKMMFAEAM